MLLRTCYFLFYRLVARFSKPPLPVDTGDFAVMSRRVVDTIKSASEHKRYVRGLRAWVGYRQIGIPIERARRQAGKAKYNFFRLVTLGLDGLFAFSVAPLRAGAIVGLMTVALSVLFAVHSVHVRVVEGRSPEVLPR